VDRAQERPFSGRVAGFFLQLALGAGQVVFAGVDLAGRVFDEHAVERIAVLALEQHGVVVEQGKHDYRARMADVFAFGDLSVRERDAVAGDFQETAVVHGLAIDAGFFQVRIHDFL
jgi:hypothetical protein